MSTQGETEMTAIDVEQETDGALVVAQEGRFDYRVLDEGTAKFAWQRAQQIRWESQSVTQGTVNIGRMLIEVQEQIPHGYWQAWLEQEFAWSRTTATKLMRVARLWGDRRLIDTAVSANAIELIGHSDIPKQVREQLLDLAEAGDIQTDTHVVSFLEQISPELARKVAPSKGHTAETTRRRVAGEMSLHIAELNFSVRNMQQALATEYGVPLKSVVADALQRLQRVSDTLIALAVELEPRDRTGRSQGTKRLSSTSQFRGVSFNSRRKKWVAQVRHNGRTYNLGEYDTEEDAARAYDAKVRELYGDDARLNFPDEH